MTGLMEAARQAGVAPRWFRRASPATAAVLGVLVVVLASALIPLAALARQNPLGNASGAAIVFGPVFGTVGFVVAWRKPRQLLGWLMLGVAGFYLLDSDAAYYAVIDYRLHHGGLPLGPVSVLLQLNSAPAAAGFGLIVLLFPDGRLPSPRWRWVLRGYLAAATLYVAGAFTLAAGAIIGHAIRVDSTGNLTIIDHPTASAGWWGPVQDVSLIVVGVCLLASVVGQVVSYRRSSGERRLQLKWLLGGAAVAVTGIVLQIPLSSNSPSQIVRIASGIAYSGVLAVPVSMGVAILKYRLYEIDRLVSRTLAYAIVTGLLVGAYVGLVLLATRVLPFSSPVAVAGSTLVVAALFNPLRRRVQRVVDRRFNRARFDADRTVAAFAARLKDAVDLDSVRDDLVGVVHQALEPAHVLVWIAGGDR